MPEPTTLGRLTFLLGGARSGKSLHAERLITTLPAPWTYIATAQPFDDEMRERIAHHRDRREQGWRTLDAPFDLAETLRALPADTPMLLDCLTLWLTNIMLAERDVDAAAGELCSVLSAPTGPWYVVSNEVGLSIVPENALARRFRDEQGRLNQKIAALADEVLFTVAGLPMKVK
ncbi:bifunctional adenosylcobinamide kinase/adenosylcobinamide-phosphate guanylyltransferase [Tianweitania populi]|uniref:Bifunctional adenosylcobalamin biosynthesis protein n=1 Tax=Tianweitania populi TaxID=1607949 RepID=A0A8J3GKQ7_9HYPH|nr:bifunctional adenosylcobinamide kinase/adenosylcobinamide-phosphate guanylyltransferase [Tianweitania populi]GHD08561.1 adenosylcobinamide kinase/adenosylcobinamide phosphate guanyltransferase [Tianweitania populi]